MGRAVSVDAAIRAADTSKRLQRAESSGVPVLIPGALEKRARPVDAVEVIADPVAASARSAEIFDRARRELELEGGGALRNRTPSRYRRMLAKFRRWV
jgi:hypothetical protein